MARGVIKKNLNLFIPCQSLSFKAYAMYIKPYLHI